MENTQTNGLQTTSITPSNSLQVLSRREIAQLYDANYSSLYDQFRQCALAVLNCGSSDDDTVAVLDKYKSFDIKITQRERGIKLELHNAPGCAFVDGEIIEGIKDHLFSVLRDIVFVQNELLVNHNFDLNSSSGTTDATFNILRNADALLAECEPNLVVCWGGHSISRAEYDYTKWVGYELGLRELDICTGCGPGAMKGPMKGAAVAHAKQRKSNGRYIGLSEPEIIAAESPNPIVNQLVIFPDIEKRLEAFVRLGHVLVVFPGGVGTAEEIFYVLSLMLHSDNTDKRIPIIFTAPESSSDYFEAIDEFIGLTLGPEAQSLYEIVVGDEEEVGRKAASAMKQVEKIRNENKDAYYFNWALQVPYELQKPFLPTHEAMAGLKLSREVPKFELAVNLRALFSGLVAGNVKAEGIEAIKRQGKFQISGEKAIMDALDQLLIRFTEQKRMKINHERYQRCYDIV
jgi:predicted Rossmann-fold nucleotide-binding protein